MNRRNLPTNTIRKLWAQCGGYCQNPSCNKYLFTEIGSDTVSFANIAHIIGHGSNGPRSTHEMAEYIDKNGIDNLIMLCLECHKIIDELEDQFSVEQIHLWKVNHISKIHEQFSFSNIYNEREILERVHELLTENKIIFEEYGPYSDRALQNLLGDTVNIWKQKCLGTIIPNNQQIIGIIESNKRNFSYPWELYRKMLSYKLHADSFRDNCLLDKKVDDYKLFPKDFARYVQNRLGLTVEEEEIRYDEEIELRKKTISQYIEQYLANHSHIVKIEQLSIAMFEVELKDSRSLRVFVTNTYFFTEYSFEKVMCIDPGVDAIICSSPYGGYTQSAKHLCIEKNIGLFTLREFMGAIRKTGDAFLDYLFQEKRNGRITLLKFLIEQLSIPDDFHIHVFGSYLRRKLFNDVDLFLVYPSESNQDLITSVTEGISKIFQENSLMLDMTVLSDKEYETLELEADNRVKIK